MALSLLLRAVMASLLLAVGPAMAGERKIAAIESVLKAGPVDTALFAPSFLAAVPPAQLEPTIAGIVASIGPVETVTERDAANYEVETATHRMPVQIVLDTEGRIAGLLLKPPVGKAASIEDIVGTMKAIAPEFGLLVTRDGAARTPSIRTGRWPSARPSSSACCARSPTTSEQAVAAGPTWWRSKPATCRCRAACCRAGRSARR